MFKLSVIHLINLLVELNLILNYLHFKLKIYSDDKISNYIFY